VVTSPPYFGQRDYRDGGESLKGQIGSEATPQEYVANLLDCTREWMRALKPSGSIFVNLGDKFSQRIQVRRSSHQPGIHVGKFEEFGESWAERAAKGATRMPHQNVINDDGYAVPEKSLMQLPQRYSIGCTDQLGLILRRDIIWHKTSGLPESVADRCHTSHEYLFHFTKEPRYFSAMDEIREPHAPASTARYRSSFGQTAYSAATDKRYRADEVEPNPLGKLLGSVWRMAPSSLTVPAWLGVDHYAAYPPELCRRIILGWSPSGICLECGEGRFPVSRREVVSLRPGDQPGRSGLNGDAVHGADRRAGTHKIGVSAITGYACACPAAAAPTRPALVIDPFGGTGTTALTASVLGRNSVTLDLGADYCRIARWRINDPGERARALGVPKPPPVPEGQDSLFDRFGEAS
jgi:DNA modification methylase